MHSQSMWEGALFFLLPTGGGRVFRLPFLGGPFPSMQSTPSSGLWSPRVRYPPGRSRLVFSPRPAEGAWPPDLPPRCAEPRYHSLPNPTPTPPRGPRVARAQRKQAWARPKIRGKQKGAQAKRVTHRTRTGTRAPGVADCRTRAGLKPSWSCTFS